MQAIADGVAEAIDEASLADELRAYVWEPEYRVRTHRWFLAGPALLFAGTQFDSSVPVLECSYVATLEVRCGDYDVSSREFNQNTSRAKRAAKKGPVFITDRGRPAHVFLTIEEYRAT